MGLGFRWWLCNVQEPEDENMNVATTTQLSVTRRKA